VTALYQSVNHSFIYSRSIVVCTLVEESRVNRHFFVEACRHVER
jgi:hypothetical protein